MGPWNWKLKVDRRHCSLVSLVEVKYHAPWSGFFPCVFSHKHPENKPYTSAVSGQGLFLHHEFAAFSSSSQVLERIGWLRWLCLDMGCPKISMFDHHFPLALGAAWRLAQGFQEPFRSQVDHEEHETCEVRSQRWRCASFRHTQIAIMANYTYIYIYNIEYMIQSDWLDIAGSNWYKLRLGARLLVDICWYINRSNLMTPWVWCPFYHIWLVLWNNFYFSISWE